MMEEENTARINFSARMTPEVFRLSFNLRKDRDKISSNNNEFSFADAANIILGNFNQNEPLPPKFSMATEEYLHLVLAPRIFARELRTLCGLISTSMSAPYLTSLNLGHDIDCESNSKAVASYVIRALSLCPGVKTLNLCFTNMFYISFLACSERHIGTMQLTSLELGGPFRKSKREIDSHITGFMSFFAAKKSCKHLSELNLRFETAVPKYRAAVLEALGIMDYAEVKKFWKSHYFISEDDLFGDLFDFDV